MSDVEKAKARLMLASFELGQAQRALEDAEKAFKKALNNLDYLQDKASREAEAHTLLISD